MKRRSKELSNRSRLSNSDHLKDAWLDYKQEKTKNAKQTKRRDAKIEIRGPALIRGLEYVFQMTGDPLFKDAQDALRSYGLDQRLTQQAPDVYDNIMGKSEIAWYRRMGHWIKYRQAELKAKKGVSTGHDRLISDAAKQICSTSEFQQGQSFKADVEKLSRGYSQWLKDGLPDEHQSAPSGDLGRLVWVLPRNGKPLRLGSYYVPIEGVAKPNDLFLRRLVMDGTVLVGKP